MTCLRFIESYLYFGCRVNLNGVYIAQKVLGLRRVLFLKNGLSASILCSLI